MTNQELRNSIIFINRIIASNNPRVAVSTLRQNGYQTQYDILSADQIEKALLELYLADSDKYISAIKQIPYISDITNWTTAPDTREQIKLLASNLNINTGDATSKTDWSSLWQGIKDGISTTITQMGGGSTTTTEPAIKPWVVILIALLGIGAILLILKFSPQS